MSSLLTAILQLANGSAEFEVRWPAKTELHSSLTMDSQAHSITY
jgi:hypothetical protein